MYYFLGFIILLGVLIFVHEFGHFIVAKLAGVKVLKFSLGFPPAMIKRKWGETEYILSWIPLGGYVKLLGEDPESDEEIAPEDQGRTFTGKPLWVRFAVILAGPLSNYLTAAVLLSAAYMAGWPVPVSEVGKVVEGTPAQTAGFMAGDRVTSVEGKPVWRWHDMRKIIEKNPGRPLTVIVERDGVKKDLSVTPALSKEKDIFGKPVGRIGIAPSNRAETLGPLAAIQEGVNATWRVTEDVTVVLIKLVKGEVSAKTLGGPITIIQASGASLKAGIFLFMGFMSFISINLAIINLLPIPILDGGHLLFFLIEAVIRRPVTGRVREIAVQAGLLFIVCLMALVFYNDISRIVNQGWGLQP